MTEERKFAILFAATILSARKLAELENPDKSSPKRGSLYSRGNWQEVATQGGQLPSPTSRPATEAMRSLRSLPSRDAGFVEPIECLAVSNLPGGSDWVCEIKLDGYRALAINSKAKMSFYSRKRKSFNRQYQHIFDVLRDLPENTDVDSEIVALDGGPRNINQARRL